MAILLVFLSVEFMDDINGTYVENNMLPWLERLKKLHLVIAQMLKPWAEKQIDAFSVRRMNKNLYDCI